MPRPVKAGLIARWEFIRRTLVGASRSLPCASRALLALTLGMPFAACSLRSAPTPVQFAAAPSSDPTTIALAEFAGRVDRYAALHREAALYVPPLEAGLSATELFHRENLLADAIRARRPQAQRGDCLTRDVAPAVRGIVQQYLLSPEGAAARETVDRENPAIETTRTPVVLSVNGAYEPSARFSTVPPTLLMRLPRLPEEVEYRFVGKHLVLRDTTANIIVDNMFDVAP